MRTQQVRTATSRFAAAVGLACAAALGLTPAASAFADTPAPTPSARAGDEPAPLSAQQVKAQLAQAQVLQKDLVKADRALAAATARLAALSARSSAAMSAVASARAAEQAARASEQAQLTRLASLSRQAAAARDDVDHMAYDAYVNGSNSLRDIAAVVDLVTREGRDSDTAALMGYLADARAADGRRFTTLAQAQQATAKAAASARIARERATATAEAAQKKVATSLAEQQRALAELQTSARATSAKLSKLGVDSSGLGSGVDLKALASMASTPLCSQDTGTYRNGAVPVTALCPLIHSPGAMLRPDAARAFNAMSLAFERDMGAPLCVTDSYRSYAAQVDVRARKPSLSAVPGTSDHGLGLALDLCGGIESFGTPAHRWMAQHAPLFGWFHPAWAGPGGSLPEPWHWEYAH